MLLNRVLYLGFTGTRYTLFGAQLTNRMFKFIKVFLEYMIRGGGGIAILLNGVTQFLYMYTAKCVLTQTT